MTKVNVYSNNGVSVVADEVEVFGKKAQLKIRVAHKNPGELLDKTTSTELAKEIAEWLIRRESKEAVILDAKAK